MEMDQRLEGLSDRVRKGIPVGFGEAIEVIEYQEKLREQRKQTPWIWRIRDWLLGEKEYRTRRRLREGGSMRTAKYFGTTEEQFEIVTWHAWGQSSSGDGAYPAAVIEKVDGEVFVVDADSIHFTQPTPTTGDDNDFHKTGSPRQTTYQPLVGVKLTKEKRRTH